MTREQLETLRWHENQANHGRGQIERVKKSLLKLKYLKLTWLGHYDWVITITDRGRQALKERGE